MHKQREKEKWSLFPHHETIFVRYLGRGIMCSVSREGKHCKSRMSPMEYPLGQFGSAGCVPSQDFPISSLLMGGGMLERQLWCYASTAHCSQNTGWNHHPPLDHKCICMCAARLSRCPDVSWTHQAINNSYYSQSKSVWAISILTTLSTCCLFQCSSVGWVLGMWASTSRPFRVLFPTHAVLQCLATTQQPRWAYPALPILPLLQPPALGISHHPGASTAQSTRHFSCSGWMAFTSAPSLHLPSLLAVSATCQGAFISSSFCENTIKILKIKRRYAVPWA